MKKFIAKILAMCLLVPVFALGNTESGNNSVTVAGQTIALPAKVERIASFAPSNTVILDGLGVADKIIALDTYSEVPKATSADVPKFDMMKPDNEKIIALKPDVVVITGMSNAGGNDPYKPTRDAGIAVITVQSAKTFDEVMESITLLGTIVGKPKEAAKINKQMAKDIADIKAAAAKIPESEKVSVYFEVTAAPYMYTPGADTFQNEMIETCGAKNIFSDLTSWASISEEQVFGKNPDVIFTTVDYLPEPIKEIKGRAGWDVLNAVKNDRVYQLDNKLVSQPCQNLTEGLKEMAHLLYPKYFK